MVRDRTQLLDTLVADLVPVTPAPRLSVSAGTWLLASLVYVAVASWLLGPLRPGALLQLIGAPQFSLEMFAGLAGIALATGALFLSAVPGRRARPLGILSALALATWLVLLVIGFWYPSLDTGMSGKRPHCYLETMLYALPPLLLGLWLVRRFYPLRPTSTALAVGLVAGLLATWYMQLACMYQTTHGLAFHLLPGLLLVPLAGVLVFCWRGKRR
jgi:hypothetical protein